MTRAHAALLGRLQRKSSRRNFSPTNTSPQSIDFADSAESSLNQALPPRCVFSRDHLASHLSNIARRLHARACALRSLCKIFSHSLIENAREPRVAIKSERISEK